MSRLLIFCLLCCTGCTHQAPVQRGFFYWKTTFALSGFEREQLTRAQTEVLYVKFLDVGRNPQTQTIEPYALLRRTGTDSVPNVPIAPAVFLTNETFKNVDNQQLEWLADHVAEALNSVGEQFPAQQRRWPVVLFDCDWTASTRTAFFAFLEKMRTRLPTATARSATIRLHQYQRPADTGVPPVERGMLMLYNTGDVEDPAGARSSIFDLRDARRYLDNTPKHYPLPLDLALPLFSWGLVFRNGELWKILPELSPTELADTTRFQHNNQRWDVRQATFVSGLYLAPGDFVRLENTDAATLQQAANLAAQKVQLAPDAAVVFYHLDSVALQRIPVQVLDSVWIRFGFKG